MCVCAACVFGAAVGLLPASADVCLFQGAPAENGGSRADSCTQHTHRHVPLAWYRKPTDTPLCVPACTPLYNKQTSAGIGPMQKTYKHTARTCHLQHATNANKEASAAAAAAAQGLCSQLQQQRYQRASAASKPLLLIQQAAASLKLFGCRCSIDWAPRTDCSWGP